VGSSEGAVPGDVAFDQARAVSAVRLGFAREAGCPAPGSAELVARHCG
jgi:hypothetical protein